MRYLLLISTLSTSLLFSAASRAEWTLVAEGARTGNKVYVDLERIRKANGLVYYWMIQDRLEPSSTGMLSTKVYYKVDCETLREMKLSFSTYKLPMAEGAADDTWTPDPQWDYAQPDSVGEGILQAVCAH